MTKTEAIEFIKASSAAQFYYGDDGVAVDKEDAIVDIELMDEEVWGDAVVTEVTDAR